MLTLVTREKSGKTRISTKAFSPIKVVVWIVLLTRLDYTSFYCDDFTSYYGHGEMCKKYVFVGWCCGVYVVV